MKKIIKIIILLSALISNINASDLNITQRVCEGVKSQKSTNFQSVNKDINASLKKRRKPSVKIGQRIFKKKFRKYCRFSGVRFARKHTQIEWEEIWDKGKFKEETKRICPRLKLRKIRKSWWKHLYKFVYTYGSDGERVPGV